MNYLRYLAAFCLLVCWSGSLVRGQDAGSTAGQIWKDARTAFASGNYTHAATLLESIIQRSGVAAQLMNQVTIPPAAPKQQWMEPVFFTLGASYFNAKDWPHAITTFNEYRQLFPKSPHLPAVIFSTAQARLLEGEPAQSIPLFTSLLPLPSYHVKVIMLLVDANKRAETPGAAITLLEKERALPNINRVYLQKLNLLLAALYLDAKDGDKAGPLIAEMDQEIDAVPNVPQFNKLAVRLGDLLLADGKIDEALGCYRKVRDNDQILSLQARRIDELQKERGANLALIQASPLNSEDLQSANKDIDVEVAADQKILIEYQKLPPVLPPLFLRVARAYSSGGQLWEAAVVYRELLRRWPRSVNSELALYGSIVVFDRLKQTDRGLALCQDYLTQYPKGTYADSVAFIRGALAYDAEDFDKARAYFADALQAQLADSPRREQIELILGDISLREAKFDDAIAAYKKYEADFPHAADLEKAEYRSALALLFDGKGDEAKAAFQAYLGKYVDGDYVADAEYRLAVIKYAGKENDEVIADCLAWQTKHGRDGPLGEVLSLLGDCYASKGDYDQAIDAYTRSFKAARSPDVLNYSIFAAAKLLQKEGKWADIATMFRQFIKDNPDHPTVVSAIYWIGRSEVKLGKIDEAKQYMAATAKQYLNDPSREAVDEIISQLAQLYARKHLPLIPVPPASTPPATVSSGAGSLASVTPPSSTVVPAVPSSAPLTTQVVFSSPAPATGPAPVDPAPVPPSDPAADLEAILTVPDLATKPTAQARILFAKAELARNQRKHDLEGQLLLQIAQQFKPENLSPILLGEAGDALVQFQKPDQALPFYNYLIDEYGKSPLVDYGYNGLGRIAYDEKDYTKADRYYSKALDKGLAATKLKEITLGEAQTLFALNQFEAAKTLFEQVASTRAWRGEATALSVYSLGEIQMQLGKYAEANAYYQRVFIAYQKYPAIQAKAYLRSGEAFEKLGKLPEARNSYAEMLKDPNLASFPEVYQAKQRIDHLAQQ